MLKIHQTVLIEGLIETWWWCKRDGRLNTTSRYRFQWPNVTTWDVNPVQDVSGNTLGLNDPRQTLRTIWKYYSFESIYYGLSKTDSSTIDQNKILK